MVQLNTQCLKQQAENFQEWETKWFVEGQLKKKEASVQRMLWLLCVVGRLDKQSYDTMAGQLRLEDFQPEDSAKVANRVSQLLGFPEPKQAIKRPEIQTVTPLTNKQKSSIEQLHSVVNPDNPLGRTFLEAIWREPTNRMHRSVYADWLEEQGNPLAGVVRVTAYITDLSELKRIYIEWPEQFALQQTYLQQYETDEQPMPDLGTVMASVTPGQQEELPYLEHPTLLLIPPVRFSALSEALRSFTSVEIERNAIVYHPSLTPNTWQFSFVDGLAESSIRKEEGDPNTTSIISRYINLHDNIKSNHIRSINRFKWGWLQRLAIEEGVRIDPAGWNFSGHYSTLIDELHSSSTHVPRVANGPNSISIVMHRLNYSTSPSLRIRLCINGEVIHVPRSKQKDTKVDSAAKPQGLVGKISGFFRGIRGFFSRN